MVTRVRTWVMVALAGLAVTAGARPVLAASPASVEAQEPKECIEAAQQVATDDFTVSHAEAAQARIACQEARAQLARAAEQNADEGQMAQTQETVPPTAGE